jgi:hypothetical protein
MTVVSPVYTFAHLVIFGSSVIIRTLLPLPAICFSAIIIKRDYTKPLST